MSSKVRRADEQIRADEQVRAGGVSEEQIEQWDERAGWQ